MTPISGGGASTGTVWINEIHYDNNSTDVGEGVEIAGPAGTDLSDYRLYLYNGNGGVAYSPTTTLSGVIGDEGCGYGALWFAIPGLQNGNSDGVALVKSATNVVQFLSYEGVLTATDGPAIGMTSVDIGVVEPSTLPIGQSLQLQGSGNTYAQFVWSTNAASTGTLNVAQTISPCGGGGPVDTDADGMSDDYETTYFTNATAGVAGNDDDGDGFSNLEEYLADTIPNGPNGSNSLFEVLNFAVPGTRAVSFVASTGRVYTFQFNDDLLLGTWSNLVTDSAGTNATTTLADTNAAVTGRSYRVRVRVP